MFQVLQIFWSHPIQLERIQIPQFQSELETILMCSEEIGLPEDLEKLLFKFYGLSYKIRAPPPHLLAYFQKLEILPTFQKPKRRLPRF